MVDSLVPAGDGIEITKTGLIIQDRSLPIDEWLDIGYTLAGLERAFRWCIGDWLNYGEFKYGEMYAQGEAVTGMNPDYLRNLKWIASRIPLSLRRDKKADGTLVGISWHQPVASLESDEEKDFWLGLAERHNWSRNELRQRIAESKMLPAPNDNKQIIVLSDKELRGLVITLIRARNAGKQELEASAWRSITSGLKDEI